MRLSRGSIGNPVPYHCVYSEIEEYGLYMKSIWEKQAYPTPIDCDSAFSSSQSVTCVVQWRDDRLNIVYTELVDKPLYINPLHLIRQLIYALAPCRFTQCIGICLVTAKN